MRLIALILILFMTELLHAQYEAVDYIERKEFNDPKFKKREVRYLFADKKSKIIKYNPISLTFGGLLLFYQTVISQQIGSNCPYEISCSEFGRLTISNYGILKGIPLTADRLTRCTEFSRIDLKPLWFNSKGQLIDPIERYRNDHKHHKH